MILLLIMVRLERFELPAFWFVARRSIQLSYRRVFQFYQSVVGPTGPPVTALGHSLVTPRPVRKILFS